MTLPRETLIDLCAIASTNAPLTMRNAATQLLAREMTARLAIGSRNWDPAPHQRTHFAFLDYEDYPALPGLDALLYDARDLALPAESRRARGVSRSKPERRVWRYVHYHTGTSGSSVPQTPGSRSTYSAALAEVVSITAELVPLVVDEVGEPAFEAAREPFVEHYAFSDFAARSDVARFAVLGAAAPGALFALDVRGGATPGYALASSEISVPAADTYSTRFYGSVRSASTSNPTAIAIALDVDGVEAGVYTETRNSADPSVSVRFANQPAVGDIGSLVDVAVGSGEVVTVRNDTASNLYAAGILLVWRD